MSPSSAPNVLLLVSAALASAVSLACRDAGSRAPSIAVDSAFTVLGKSVPPDRINTYVARATGLESFSVECAYVPLAQEHDVVLVSTMCIDFARDGDSLHESSRREAAFALRVATGGDTARIVAHALLSDSGAPADSVTRGLASRTIAAALRAAPSTISLDTMAASLRRDAETRFGLRPAPHDTLTLRPAADWASFRDSTVGLELQLPAGWLPLEHSQLAPCTAKTPSTKSSVLPFNGDDEMLGEQPLTIAMRRGTEADAINANGFQVTAFGIGSGGRAGSGGTTEMRRGASWIALAGDFWVGHYAPEGGLLSQESTMIAFGAVDVGDGCRIIIAERGAEVVDIDSLAAVLSTVRVRR